MSPVQSVTDVTVHSPLRKVWFPCWARSAGDRTSLLLLQWGRRCGQERDCYETLCSDPVRRLSNIRVADHPFHHVPIPTRNCLHYGQPCHDRRPETSVLPSSVQPPRRLLKMALARPLLVLRRLRPWRRDRCSGTSRMSFLAAVILSTSMKHLKVENNHRGAFRIRARTPPKG